MPKLLLKLPNPNIESEFKYRLPGHNVDSKCYLRYYSANNLLAKQIIILTELPDQSRKICILILQTETSQILSSL